MPKLRSDFDNMSNIANKLSQKVDTNNLPDLDVVQDYSNQLDKAMNKTYSDAYTYYWYYVLSHQDTYNESKEIYDKWDVDQVLASNKSNEEKKQILLSMEAQNNKTDTDNYNIYLNLKSQSDDRANLLSILHDKGPKLVYSGTVVCGIFTFWIYITSAVELIPPLEIMMFIGMFIGALMIGAGIVLLIVYACLDKINVDNEFEDYKTTHKYILEQNDYIDSKLSSL